MLHRFVLSIAKSDKLTGYCHTGFSPLNQALTANIRLYACYQLYPKMSMKYVCYVCATCVLSSKILPLFAKL